MPIKIFLTAILLLMTTAAVFAQNAPPIEPGVSQALARWRGLYYSNVRYRINLTLEKGAPLMKGEIEIRVDLTLDGATSDLILDWRTTQFQNDKDQPYAFVTKLNATESAPDKTQIPIGKIINEHLVLPKEFLKPGENVIKINFASPIKTSGAGVTRYVDKEDGAEYIYSLFVPSDASTTFPVFDQPDLKARFSLEVFAPEDWTVISNTKGENFVNGDGRKRSYSTKFPETKPISTYVFAFATGEFLKWNECDYYKKYFDELKCHSDAVHDYQQGSNVYVRKSQAEKFKQHASEVFRLNREGVKFLESYFDYKFPFPKYDLVLLPEFPFGGMEHAGATFLRESSVIFPTEPTKNDYVSRANVIFHEAAHQWFGDTVTMKWFDDLWLKEGFAEFMAYKTLEKVMPEYNAWKIFYERNKQAAYLTDSTKGTTPIYQEIPNLSAAKSAYGNIVYRKAPSFLKQAEFYLGEKEFQTAVRAFLKKHEFGNASWQDLVSEFAEVKLDNVKAGERYQKLSSGDKAALEAFTKWSVEKEWAEFWVEKRGTQIYRLSPRVLSEGGFSGLNSAATGAHTLLYDSFSRQATITGENYNWLQDVKVLKVFSDGERRVETVYIGYRKYARLNDEEAKPRENLEFKFEITEEEQKKYQEEQKKIEARKPLYVFPNYQDYGYGIFLLDEKSRAYVLANIQNEKDDFLRAMMWGSLWDSVREAELDPKTYVELVIKNISVESDESTIQTLLGRVGTAMNYYLSDDLGFGNSDFGLVSNQTNNPKSQIPNPKSNKPSATADGSDLAAKLETLLIDKMQNAPTLGQRITFYRAFLNVASSENARNILKDIRLDKLKIKDLNLRLKDRYDILIRLGILNDKETVQEILKKYGSHAIDKMSDEERRYAFASGASIPDAEIKKYYFENFIGNKDISESWIEAAFVPFNSSRHSDLTLPYLAKALNELPNLKKNRKIFFVNGWLSAFVGGQKSAQALSVVNKFLADNPKLDRDLRLKILENADNLERAVKIRAKFAE